MGWTFNPTITRHMSIEFVKDAMGDCEGPWGMRVSDAEAEAMIGLLCERFEGVKWADAEFDDGEWTSMLDKAVKLGAE